MKIIIAGVVSAGLMLALTTAANADPVAPGGVVTLASARNSLPQALPRTE